MKKILFSLLALSMLLGSCGKKEEPIDNGSVTLSPATATMYFNDKLTITPKFSNTVAQNKTGGWSTSNDTIASVKPATGGVGEVTAKRIGDAVITYKTDDGTVSNTCKITVSPRSKILGNIFYVKGAKMSTVDAQETGSKNTAESTATLAVYDRSSGNVTKMIYQFDANGGLIATYAIVDYSPNNQTLVEQYLEERYAATIVQKNLITYFDAGVSPLYENNVYVGIFKNQDGGSGSGKAYPLGVRFVDKSYLN